ncbi:MAG: trimeric intracellular cation channel family protein [Gammaproteobacteria bacterium]|nr:trimeric intracellular cation channel family protein [Gammaproteobacteria bacterium]
MEFASVSSIIHWISILATAAMAVSAVAMASRSGFDPYGALVLAAVASVGGGTLRDVLIGATPVFWVDDLSYVLTIIPTALLAIVGINFVPTGRGIRLNILEMFDAAGLALFCALGVQKSLIAGIDPIVAVLMGLITGTAGGMFRDVLCGQKPSVLQRDLYASCALVGALVYIGLHHFEFSALWTLGLSAAVTFTLRLYAIFSNWSERSIRWRH